MWRPSGVTPLNERGRKSFNDRHSWRKLKWASIQWVTGKKNWRLGLKRCKNYHPAGWRHHADLPLPEVHNSQPILSKNSHPLQGSQRVDTWRTWIQQVLQSKYNWPVRFLLVNTLFSITWVVAEKGKGDKPLVPRNANLKKKKCCLRAGWVSQIL